MSSLLNQVTPLTRGIIWLTKNERDVQNPYYKEIDYLLDGLLTANLNTAKDLSSQVIIGNNFDKLFYVLVAKDVLPAEVNSYLSLFQNDLVSENDILVIDESKSFEKLKPLVKSISSQIRLV